MTGPSGTPRGERPGRPGATWETELRWSGEWVVADDEPLPRANRATRRVAKRARGRLRRVPAPDPPEPHPAAERPSDARTDPKETP